ncbi:MAG: hypothetical protein FD167_1650 [bacterium]|nr:MAG: hypothetical protein FD167_1650 [bacterium]
MSSKEYPKDKNKKTGYNEDKSEDKGVVELKVLDPKLVEVVKFALPPTEHPPDWVERNVMLSYKKHNRYHIFWRKLKNNHWKDLLEYLPSHFTFQYALGTIVLLIAIGGVLYYQFSKKQISVPLISKDQSPVIKFTITPNIEPTPSPTSSTTNTNNKPDNNQLPDKVKQNSDKTNKENNNNLPLNNNLEDEKIAHNNIYISPPPDTIRGINKEKINSLSKVKTVYLGSFGDSEQDKYLKEAIKIKLKSFGYTLFNPSEQAANPADITIKKDGDTIKIVNSNDKILLTKNIKNITSKPIPEITKYIISDLAKNNN